MLTCKRVECGFVFNSAAPSAATLSGNHDEDDQQRITDYAININYVLGFCSAGDGGAKAACVLGLLGLPNDTTMESRSFPTLEERIIGYFACQSNRGNKAYSEGLAKQ